MNDHRRSFRLADLMTLGILALICVALITPVLAKEKELDSRTRCAANLNGIAKASLVYANEYSDILPCTWAGESVTKYSLTFDNATFKVNDGAGINGGRPGDPTACLWILVAEGSVSTKSFLCRSDNAATAPADSGKAGALFLGFQDPKNLSYSIAYPWVSTDKKGGTVGNWWKARIDSSVPIMSDMAPFNEPKGKPVIDPSMKNAVEVEVDMSGGATQPDAKGTLDALLPKLNDDSPEVRSAANAELAKLGTPGVKLVTAMDLTQQPLQTRVALKNFLAQMKDQMVIGKTYNSPNHGFAGQNIVFADAHAEWYKTPQVDLGQNVKHNIWLNGGKDGETVISAGDIGTALDPKSPSGQVMVPMRASDGSIK